MLSGSGRLAPSDIRWTAVTTLAVALGLAGREVVALVGGGGKTTALFRLARELLASGAGPLVTTTTKIYVPTDPDVDVLSVETAGELRDGVARAIGSGRVPVAARRANAEGKLTGVPPEWVAEMAALPAVTHVLVEADGARRLPITAPRDDEPVIPPSATLVVPVVGMDAYGAPLAAVAHRPERVGALTGLGAGDVLDARAIARVLLGAQGNTKGAPATAHVVPLVNKVDDGARLRDARALAVALHEAGAARVVLAALAGRGVVEVSVAHARDTARESGRSASR